MRPGLRLGLLVALFVTLTVAGVWWALPPREVLAETWRQLAGFSFGRVAFLLSLAVGLIGAEMVRLIVFGRALGVPVSIRAALDATIADNFFSWLTPGAAFGYPSAIFMLARHGVPWSLAALIVFGQFVTGFAFIMALTSLALAFGFGPAVVPWAAASFAVASGFVASMAAGLVLAAFWPERSERSVRRLEARMLSWRFARGALVRRLVSRVSAEVCAGILKLGDYRRAGAPGVTGILLSHVAYYSAFIGVFIAGADAFGAKSWTSLVPSAVIYQGFLYVAPTPGGAGLGEATANVFFGEALPGGAAFAAVMLYRSLTFYLHVVIGLVYLPAIGALGRILRAREPESQE